MTSPSLIKPAGTVGQLLRARLREVKRSTQELAEAIQVPPHYVDELIEGSRRPPHPERTDIYGPMTTFLRLGRQEIVSNARAERAEARATGARPARAEVRRMLLALCEPRTARRLQQRRSRRGGAELTDLFERLLDITQGSVRRMLDDHMALRRVAATQASTYMDVRFRLLEFLDATPATLTADDLVEFLQPRISRWDVDAATGVLRVVLRPQINRPRPPTRY